MLPRNGKHQPQRPRSDTGCWGGSPSCASPAAGGVHLSHRNHRCRAHAAVRVHQPAAAGHLEVRLACKGHPIDAGGTTGSSLLLSWPAARFQSGARGVHVQVNSASASYLLLCLDCTPLACTLQLGRRQTCQEVRCSCLHSACCWALPFAAAEHVELRCLHAHAACC